MKLDTFHCIDFFYCDLRYDFITSVFQKKPTSSEELYISLLSDYVPWITDRITRFCAAGRVCYNFLYFLFLILVTLSKIFPM